MRDGEAMVRRRGKINEWEGGRGRKVGIRSVRRSWRLYGMV